MLKLVAGAIVNELKKLNQNIAALSVSSSVMDRLSYLLPSARPELGVGPGRSVDRSGSTSSCVLDTGVCKPFTLVIMFSAVRLQTAEGAEDKPHPSRVIKTSSLWVVLMGVGQNCSTEDLIGCRISTLAQVPIYLYVHEEHLSLLCNSTVPH